MGKHETSAGLVLCRRSGETLEVLLVHPGGPFWAKKDAGAWSIPKGLVEPGEDLLAAVQREAREELGLASISAPFVELGDVRLKSGKRVVAWAGRADFEPSQLRSNEIEIEWPPRSGRTLRVPEVDRACWASIEVARQLANPALIPLLERAISRENAVALGLVDPPAGG